MRLLKKDNGAESPRRRRQKADATLPASAPNHKIRSFKRNQTLTGSASSLIQALSEDSAHLKSPRVQAQALAKKRRHVGLTLLIVITVASVLAGLIYQFTAEVAVTPTPDASIQLDVRYAKTIQAYLQARPLERLRFLNDTSQLLGYLQANHPEVKNLTPEGNAGFGASRFALSFRRPIASWNMGGQQLYVDEAGVPFKKNYFQTPSVQISDQSGLQATAGQAVASNRFLAFVGQIVGQASQQGYIVTEVIIPPNTTREIDVRLKDISYPIKLSVDRGPIEQIEDMGRAIRWLQANQQAPQYLDVRSSGRAFYK